MGNAIARVEQYHEKMELLAPEYRYSREHDGYICTVTVTMYSESELRRKRFQAFGVTREVAKQRAAENAWSKIELLDDTGPSPRYKLQPFENVASRFHVAAVYDAASLEEWVQAHVFEPRGQPHGPKVSCVGMDLIYDEQLGNVVLSLATLDDQCVVAPMRAILGQSTPALSKMFADPSIIKFQAGHAKSLELLHVSPSMQFNPLSTVVDLSILTEKYFWDRHARLETFVRYFCGLDLELRDDVEENPHFWLDLPYDRIRLQYAISRVCAVVVLSTELAILDIERQTKEITTQYEAEHNTLLGSIERLRSCLQDVEASFAACEETMGTKVAFQLRADLLRESGVLRMPDYGIVPDSDGHIHVPSQRPRHLPLATVPSSFHSSPVTTSPQNASFSSTFDGSSFSSTFREKGSPAYIDSLYGKEAPAVPLPFRDSSLQYASSGYSSGFVVDQSHPESPSAHLRDVSYESFNPSPQQRSVSSLPSIASPRSPNQSSPRDFLNSSPSSRIRKTSTQINPYPQASRSSDVGSIRSVAQRYNRGFDGVSEILPVSGSFSKMSPKPPSSRSSRRRRK